MKKLTPFKLCCLQNFPFIENDIQALDNYGIMCILIKQVELLTGRVIKLDDYITKLDLQDEVNAKLDEMAKDGSLSEIIAQYIQLNGVLAYNTVTDLKNATNLINGSLAKTYGYHSVNDGGSAYYYIKTVNTDDVIDESFTIKINDTLVAHLIYNDFIYMKQIGCYADNVNDDTNKIKLALTKNKNLFFNEGTYLTSDVIDINNKIKIIGNNSTVNCNSNTNAFNLNADEIIIDGLNIKGQNVIYGYNVNSNYCVIKNLNIENIKNIGVMLIGSHNTVDNVTAKNCGWDCVGNYGSASYNKILNSNAISCYRHGFSTDPTTNNISFINCYCENIGNPSLSEGHSCFHFEHSNFGLVENCKILYNENHLNNETISNSPYIGVRVTNSNDVLINNLNCIFSENYAPKDVSRPVLYENSQNLKIINSNIINNSANSNVGQIYINSPIELNNNNLLNINIAQSDAYQGYIKKMINNNITLNNKTYFAYFYYLCEKSIIANNNFKGNSNLDYFFKGRFVNTSFENNIFDTGIQSIILTNDATNSDLKSIANRILNNTFKDLTKMISFISIDNDTTFVEKNLFTGTCDYVFEGNYNFAQIKENYKNNLTVNQNVKLNLYVDIFDDLKSTFDYRSYALNSSNDKFYISVDENGNLKSNQLQ